MISRRCNLCGSNSLDLYCGSEKMLQCPDCGIVILSSEQIPSDLDSYYQNNCFYAQNAGDPGLVRQMVKTARFYLRIITKYLDFPSGRMLVDVGSNYGALVEESVKLGFQSIGLEKNNFLVEVGKKRGLNILTTDLLRIVQTPDIITAMHVLEHLTSPRLFIKDAHEKLLAGGVLVIGVPNIKSYLAKKDGLSWRYIALEHLFYFSSDTLSTLLKQEGFSITKIVKDHSNLDCLSIKKLLHYLGGRPLVRDRFQMKNWTNRAAPSQKKISWVKEIIKRILVFIIKILRREDFIVIIAKKQ